MQYIRKDTQFKYCIAEVRLEPLLQAIIIS